MINWIDMFFLSMPILIIILHVMNRGYFWKSKSGEELKFKEFLSRWKDGMEGITPLQQTRTTLWSFFPLVFGVMWGLVVTLMSGTYWMSLILGATLPITSIQVLSTWQKYRRLKLIHEATKDLGKPKRGKK